MNASAALVLAALWMRTRNVILLALIHGGVVPKFQEIGGLRGFIPPP